MKILNKTAFLCSILSMLCLAGCAGTYHSSICQTKPSTFNSVAKKPNQAIHTNLQLTIIGKVMIDQFGNVYSDIKGNEGKIHLHKIGQYKVNGAPLQLRKVTDKNTKLQLTAVGNVVIDQYSNVYSVISKNGKINLDKIGQYKVNHTKAQLVKSVSHTPHATNETKPVDKSHTPLQLTVVGNVMIDQHGNVYSDLTKNGKVNLRKIGQYKVDNAKALPFKRMSKKGVLQLSPIGKVVIDQHGSVYSDFSKKGKVNLHKIGPYKVKK